MKKFVLPLFLFFLHQSSSGQGFQNIGGTYISMISRNDGIIVAADSRVVFHDWDDYELCYDDNFQKIFPYGKNLIAIGGRLFVRDTCPIYFLPEFCSPSENPSDLLVDISNFFSKRYPGQDSILRLTYFYIAGYNNEKEDLCFGNIGLENSSPINNDYFTSETQVNTRSKYIATESYLTPEIRDKIVNSSLEEATRNLILAIEGVSKKSIRKGGAPAVWFIPRNGEKPYCLVDATIFSYYPFYWELYDTIQNDISCPTPIPPFSNQEVNHYFKKE